MKAIEYQAHKIMLASYQDSDMPGHWFPRVEVTTPSAEVKFVSLPPVRGGTKEKADADALAVAKSRIASHNL